MKTNSVPKIRFKGFTDDWEQRKLGEFADIVTGKLDANAMKEDGEYDFYTSGIQKYKIDVPAFEGPAITIAGNGATVGYMHLADGKFNAYQRTYVLSAFQANRKFLFYEIGNKLPQKIAQEARTGNIPYIVMDMLTDLQIFIPPEHEQSKIGEYFSNLDRLITLHQRKCEQTKELKKFMLQKMFPKKGEKNPEIRFPGFTDDWEQRKLGELVTFSKGSGYSKGDLLKEGTPIILYGRLYTKYETVISNVDTFVEPKGKSVFSKGGEVIVPGSGETAEDISIASVVEESGVLLGGDLNIITPPKEINSAFLAISISNGKPHKDMAKMAQGKSVVHLHNSDLAKIDFPFPIYEEQCRISNQFAELDNLITLHQRKCEQLKELKKFMLQNMFPKKG